MDSALERLVTEVLACSQADSCMNSPVYRGKDGASCRDCRLAVAGGGAMNRWRPTDRRLLHPDLVQEKRDAKKKRVQDKLVVRKSKDKAKQEINRVAERAERTTERRLAGRGAKIVATRNSGRSHQDGDHALHLRDFQVQLDTKLQTSSIHPVVRLDELDKIRHDAHNGGAVAGGLVIRNKHGRGVVVFAEEDFPRIMNEHSD